MTRSTSLVAVCFSEVPVAFLQFLEEPDVLNGDHGLVRKGFQKRDLLVREWTDLSSANKNHPDRNSLAQ